MPADPRKIFIGNLPEQCSQKDIEDLFLEYGSVKSIEMKIARGNKPFCFLTYDSSEDAEQAVQAKNGYMFKDKALRVDHTRDDTYITPGPSLKGKYKVKVKGLPYSASWQDLKDFMRKAAEVGYAKIIQRGVGLIEFPRKSDMYYAIEKLDGTEFKNHFDSAYVRIRRYYSDEERSSRSRSRSRHHRRHKHRKHRYSSSRSSRSSSRSFSKSRSRSRSHKKHHHRRSNSPRSSNSSPGSHSRSSPSSSYHSNSRNKSKN